MIKWLKTDFWGNVARVILRNRILILTGVGLVTAFMMIQWKNIRFTFTEANMLPNDHPINIEYQKFLETFGEEGNLILLAIDNDSIFTPNNLNQWNKLSQKLREFAEVETVISVDNLPIIKKNNTNQRFEIHQLIPKGKQVHTQQQTDSIRYQLFERLPFYQGIITNKQSGVLQMALYLDKKIVNTKKRKDFIIDDFVPLVEKFQQETHLKVHVSGMPYIRTLSAQNIMDEIGIFIGAALLVTAFIFFLFFRSFRAMFISMSVVAIGVTWTFGFLGLFDYEITILTGLIPPLIIVIGIPNCIFLINKYQLEIQKHGNQARSLQRVISKVGNVTLLTNLTTSLGFATFIFTDSTLLKEFGIVASLNILSIFILSLLLIPIIYSFMKVPKEKHLRHLTSKRINNLVKWMENTVKHHRIAVFLTSVFALAISIAGIYQMKISGSLIEDMPKSANFFDDILFFEKEFGGIMPLEITIDTKRKNGVMQLANLNKIDELSEFIEEIPEISNPISVVNIVKYAKQAYYNGNPQYYDLPTPQEQSFIMTFVRNSQMNNNNMLNNYVDSLGQVARITTFMKDIGTEKMQKIEEEIYRKAQKIFPEDRYEVKITGKAFLFTKGTNYLGKNLIYSLGLAVVLISLIMACMFRSFKMILISLAPNILPLFVTAAMMGFLGIPLKPSTVLVFSIAFGISVDDTIHFLAKYRQELIARNWKIHKSVYASIREVGVSMFYTSVVLFFGFSVFMISSFGGTKALGGLVSFTLFVAMLTNLLLLPSLLLSLEKSIANKETLRANERNLFLGDEQHSTEKDNKK